MKLYYFSEMPHHEYPDEEGASYPSLRLAFPNRFFDRAKAASNYQRYLTEYELADRVGFDGLMINEHHSTPSCVNVGANMTAAVLGRTTTRAKLLILGNILPIEDNPVRMAEQIAMADLISGGRILSGFVRGVFRAGGQHPDLVRRGIGRILERSPFVRDVPDVSIAAIDLLRRL